MWVIFFWGDLEEAGTNDVLGVKYMYIHIYRITPFIPCLKLYIYTFFLMLKEVNDSSCYLDPAETM